MIYIRVNQKKTNKQTNKKRNTRDLIYETYLLYLGESRSVNAKIWFLAAFDLCTVVIHLQEELRLFLCRWIMIPVDKNKTKLTSRLFMVTIDIILISILIQMAINQMYFSEVFRGLEPSQIFGSLKWLWR